MTTNNVTDINVNKEAQQQAQVQQEALTDAQIEGHMKAWTDAVVTNDYLGVIAALNAYAADLESVQEGLGIVSIPAYIEMLGMLKGSMEENSRRVVYTPAKGWYDAGVDGENIGA